MEIYQLETFAAVAREGSITRAAERLHLSQPAVSAHVKALEQTLGLTLFERTTRGMSLTDDGRRLLVKAEATLVARREMLEEAARIKGRLTGRIRLGVGANSNPDGIGRMVAMLSERYPEVEVVLRQGDTREVVEAITGGRLDAGFYNEAGAPESRLVTTQVASFGLYLAAPVGLAAASSPLNWDALADVPWIGPDPNTCCGRAAEELFQRHGIRPRRLIRVDRESVTHTLIAAEVGVGILHSYTAEEAAARGDVQLVCKIDPEVRVLFAHLASRADEPLLRAALAVIRRVAVR